MRTFRQVDQAMQSSDEELLLQYRTDGDPYWVGLLFERYTHLVYLVCMKYLKDEWEAEDMSMRVFEKLMTDLKKYEIQAFRPWLHTVVKRHCLLHLSREKRQREQADNFEQEARSELLQTLTPFSQAMGPSREAQLTLLEETLKTLKPAQRQCVELFYLQQLSYQEVAEQTGFSLKQVKSYIQNGKRMLRINMEKHHS